MIEYQVDEQMLEEVQAKLGEMSQRQRLYRGPE